MADNQEVDVLAPDGTQGTVPTEQLERALRQGYRVPGQPAPMAKGEAFDSPAAAAAMSAMQAAMPGSGIAIASNPWLKAGAKGLAEQNPVASKVGEAAGMLASPIGEAGTVVRGAVGATSALGRIGAVVASGALEGSLFGAGNALNEAALGDHELNAEKLLAAGGLGAVLGAAGGGVGGVLSEGVGVGTRKLADLFEDSKGMLKSLSRRMGFRAMGGGQAEVRKLGLERQQEVMETAFARGHVNKPGAALDSISEDMGNQAKAVGAEVGLPSVASGELHPGLSNEEASAVVGKALDVHGAMIGEPLDYADQMGATFATKPLQQRLAGWYGGLNASEQRLIKPFYDNALGDLEKGRFFRSAEEQASPDNWFPVTKFSEANGIRSTLDKSIAWDSEGAGALLGLKKQLMGHLRDEIDSQLGPQVGSDLFKQYIDAKKSYSLMAEARDALRSGKGTGEDAIRAIIDRSGSTSEPSKLYGLLSDAKLIAERGVAKGANSSIGLRDLGVGSALGLLHGNPLTGIAGAIGYKLLRENAPAMSARLADRISESPVLKTVADHFASALAKTGTSQFGDFGAVLANALAMSPQDALATHMVLASQYPRQYAPLAATAGFPQESPEDTQAALHKANGLLQLKGALEAHDEDSGRAIGRAINGGAALPASALKSQDFGAKRMGRETIDAYQARRAEVQRFAANPQGVADRVAQNLGPLQTIAPQTAAALAATASRAIAYLHAELPPEPMNKPLQAPLTPSHAEAHSFARVLRAVQEPQSLHQLAATKRLTPDAVDAVRTVYPKLYGDLRQRVVERLAESPRSVSSQQRGQLALLTGMDLDGTQGPQFAQALQGALSGPSRKPSTAPPKPKAPKAAFGKMTMARRSRTPFQRVEAEDEP